MAVDKEWRENLGTGQKYLILKPALLGSERQLRVKEGKVWSLRVFVISKLVSLHG